MPYFLIFLFTLGHFNGRVQTSFSLYYISIFNNFTCQKSHWLVFYAHISHAHLLLGRCITLAYLSCSSITPVQAHQKLSFGNFPPFSSRHTQKLTYHTHQQLFNHTDHKSGIGITSNPTVPPLKHRSPIKPPASYRTLTPTCRHKKRWPKDILVMCLLRQKAKNRSKHCLHLIQGVVVEHNRRVVKRPLTHHRTHQK